MFPTSPKLILLGIAVALLLWVARFPASWVALRKLDISKSDRRLITVAMPRGLAAGVLSAMPFALNVPHTENLSAGVFAAIVASILIFAMGFSFFNRQN